ncbi:uncharacterized protein LOC122499907 isoform X2 [Leptopilina heterotoma]|uniref:uncharacterized protein LOC122499907 isoform X2 n=1 Tax=Leptopilina heterotoma TaxID=63436 RepID=UPI001CA90D36|nr:uncharacterized protein LOC122499907 isoform X2 [Leptopilina heterotoma]XP_043464437.1 uncharacterized protein LOC122499907 isoform X2 [Leptopilina heterotoma]
MSFNTFSMSVETVSVISIYSYFISLNDFLLSENYLSVNDLQKPIPVVNAFYKYFDEHPENLNDLIRSLLQGTDLYGEEANETLDDFFVNTMFDHLISSLVFEKFGNIYGFLAEVVRRTDNLFLDNFFLEIKNSLRDTEFENQYGNSSSLTPLAVERIFLNLISPLFPKAKSDTHLLSLDYIYAQAGSIFLQPARMNTTYYSSMYAEAVEINNETLFDEYLLIGHLIEQLIINEKIDVFNVTTFALPALFLYVSRGKEILEKGKITNILFNQQQWIQIYKEFFSYLDETYYKINEALLYDTQYNLHFELTEFKTISVLARYLIDNDLYCASKTKEMKSEFVSFYIKDPSNFQCRIGQILPNLTKYYNQNIENIIEAYVSYEDQSLSRAIAIFFHQWNLDMDVIVILLNNNLTASYDIDLTEEPKDFFAIYFREQNTVRYFSITRKNYNARIFEVSGFPGIFEEIVCQVLKDLSFITKISFLDQTRNIKEKILEDRSNRLRKVLTSSKLKDDWWKEFSLSLVPLYPCLSGAIQHEIDDPHICQVDLFSMYPINSNSDEISMSLLEASTEDVLHSLGTNIKTLSLKNLIKKIVKKKEDLHYRSLVDHFDYKQLSTFFTINQMEFKTNRLQILSRPWNFTAENIDKLIDILRENIRLVKIKTSLDYTSIFNMLNHVDKFVNHLYRIPVTKYKYLVFDLLVCSHYLYGDSGYGYKFILSDFNDAGILRTIYEYDTSREVILHKTRKYSTNDKEFIVIDAKSRVETNEYLYEVDNKIQYTPHRLRFNATEISNYYLIDCLKKNPNCPRIKNKKIQESKVNEVIKRALIQLPKISKENLTRVIKNYVFPDINFTVQSFVDKWKNETDFLHPKFDKNFTMENKDDFLKLLYNVYLDEENLTLSNVTTRINAIYNQEERNRIEMSTTLENILIDFENGKERLSATFEDYYALRNFGTTGHRRIMYDTNEAKRMKIALYKLAIRQSDDRIKNFNFVLSKLISVPTKSVKKLFYDREKLTIQKFTFTEKLDVTNKNRMTVKKKGYENILLLINFSNLYLRAKIKQIFNTTASFVKTILLPGSKFKLTERRYYDHNILGTVLQIKLQYIHERGEIFKWYQRIMKTISEIKL